MFRRWTKRPDGSRITRDKGLTLEVKGKAFYVYDGTLLLLFGHSPSRREAQRAAVRAARSLDAGAAVRTDAKLATKLWENEELVDAIAVAIIEYDPWYAGHLSRARVFAIDLLMGESYDCDCNLPHEEIAQIIFEQGRIEGRKEHV